MLNKINYFIDLFIKVAGPNLQLLAQKYNLQEEEISRINNLNPLPSANLEWVIKQVISFDENDIWPTLNLFLKKKNLLDKKDISQYKDIKELENSLKELPTSNKDLKERLLEEPKYESFFEEDDSDWGFSRGDNKSACVSLGGGESSWCITMTNATFYEQYTGANTLFYFLTSKTRDKGSFNRVAFAVKRDNESNVHEIEAFDLLDNKYTITEIKEILGDVVDKVESIIIENAPSVPEGDVFKYKKGILDPYEALKLLEMYDFGDSEIDVNDIFKMNTGYYDSLLKMNHPTAVGLTYKDRDKDIDLNKYVNSKSKKIKELLSNSTNISAQSALILSKDKYEYVRKNIARNPNTPPDVLINLSKDENAYVRGSIAQNLNTPPDVLINLITDEEEIVRGSIAQNLNTPPDVLIHLSEDEYIYVRKNIAKSPNTPPEALTNLSEGKDEYIREHVARNPNTPPDVLINLSKDKNGIIVQNIAENPNTPPEILINLSKDESEHVREHVAGNPNTPPKALINLSKDVWPSIIWYVAGNPNTTPEVLTNLSKHSPYIRQQVASNPNTPPEVLTNLSKDKYKDVRQQVASNPNTPPEVLTNLSKDKYKDVRRQVTSNPNAPREAFL